MILICSDGSDDALAAIDHVADLMPGADVTILTVWERYVDIIVNSGVAAGGWAPMLPTDPGIDEASAAGALKTAEAGAERAEAGGLHAQARAVPMVTGGAGRAILAIAAETDAGLIVLGTRGRGAWKSFVLGSVSHDVVQHADRPVLVVPSPQLAEERRAHAHAQAPARSIPVL